MSDYKYIKLKNKILEKIGNGEYAESKLIPSERILAKAENCSRMTVRQALTSLVQEGILYRRQGQGTFVSTHKFTQNNIMSFSKSISSKGKMPNTVVAFFLKKNISTVGSIPFDFEDQLYFIAKRIRYADKTAIAIETVYIPFNNCPNLKEENLKGSLHDVMDKKYDMAPKNSEFSVSASICSDADQTILNVSKNTAVLNIVSKYYSESSKLIYIEKAVYRGDMFEYEFVSNKGQANPIL